MNPLTVVKEWLTRVQQPRSELNGRSICPFATMPNVVVVTKLSLDNVKPISHSLTIYIEHSINSTFEDIDGICRTLKETHNDYIFLPDHPEKKNCLVAVTLYLFEIIFVPFIIVITFF